MQSSEYSSPAEPDSTALGSTSYDGVSNSNEGVSTPGINYNPLTDPPTIDSPPANPKRSLTVPGKGSPKTNISRLSFKRSIRSLRPQASRRSIALSASFVDGGPSASPPGRTLHIHRIGLTSRHLVIKDNDNITALYIVNSHRGYSDHPHVEIFSTNTSVSRSEIIGTVLMSADLRQASFSVHGKSAWINTTGFSSNTYKFQSTSLGELRWISDGLMSCRWKCMDSNDRIVAKYQMRRIGLGKEMVILFQNATGGGWAMEKRVVDEIVVSGLAITQCQKRRTARAPGGASSVGVSRSAAYGGTGGGAAASAAIIGAAGMAGTSGMGGGAVCSTGGGGC